MNRKLNINEQGVFISLKEVVDPELMINIIDLGLVYDVNMDNSKKEIKIDLMLTSPECPMGDVIMENAKQLVAATYPDYNVKVCLVWEPMWTSERLTAEGKKALGMTS